VTTSSSGTRPVGIAVIGAGYWGNNLIRNAQACEQTDLITVCDADVERARRAARPFGDVAVTASLEEVLADPAVEAVAIATPAATHHPIAMAALAAGKHVLVEKPLASTYAQGQEMVAEAERRGLVLMVDHTFCYTPVVQKIRELVHNGDLGDILFFDSVRINLGLVQPDVDVLWDLAPHDLSILDYVLPEDQRALAVAAHGADPIHAGKACVAYLTLTLPDDAIAHAHVNWLSPTKVRTTVIGGSKRTLVWDDLNPTMRITIFDRGVDLITDPAQVGREERAAAMVSYRSGDMIAPALPEREALREVMRELAGAIREGRPAATDGRAGLRVLDLLDSASRSMAFHGATVPLRGLR
jgi:predicted dehydrogenase